MGRIVWSFSMQVVFLIPNLHRTIYPAEVWKPSVSWLHFQSVVCDTLNTISSSEPERSPLCFYFGISVYEYARYFSIAATIVSIVISSFHFLDFRLDVPKGLGDSSKSRHSWSCWTANSRDGRLVISSKITSFWAYRVYPVFPSF